MVPPPPLEEPSDDSEKTTLVEHTYTMAGEFIVTLTVSNGELSGVSIEDVDVLSGAAAAAPIVTGNPSDQSVYEGDLFTFIASAWGSPAPTVQWQVSTDSGATMAMTRTGFRPVTSLTM